MTTVTLSAPNQLDQQAQSAGLRQHNATRCLSANPKLPFSIIDASIEAEQNRNGSRQ